MNPRDTICPFCSQSVATRVPVVFNHSDVVHLDCYVGAEGVATLAQTFLVSGSSERFCYICLAHHVARERQEVEKAAFVLRLTRSVVIEPAICATCIQAGETIRAGGSARP